MTNTDVPCVARPARTFVFQNSNGEDCEYVRADIADDLLAALEAGIRHFGGHSGKAGDQITQIEFEQRANWYDHARELIARARGEE